MPAREHVLLSDAERATLFRIPTNPDELARRFMLEKADLDLIGERRHDRNRLGMALQFGCSVIPG
jgi:TnpA family transposase